MPDLDQKSLFLLFAVTFQILAASALHAGVRASAAPIRPDSTVAALKNYMLEIGADEKNEAIMLFATP